MPHCNKQMISFFMTTECNLRCTYCYNQDVRKEKQSLSLEIAKAGIDEYFAKNTSRHIRFYGPGEPTEEFDTMCKIVEYAKEQDKKEWRAIRDLLNNKQGEKIMFLRIDKGQVEGIFGTTDGYIDVSKDNIEEVVNLIVER